MTPMYLIRKMMEKTKNSKLLEWGEFRLDLSSRTCVMGILNATPDSFSDGGKFFNFDDAVAQGLMLVAQGADILDIGGESSRPFSKPVPADEEIKRVVPVIKALSKQVDVPISIDTMKSEVAREAIKAGASIINDITAMEHDPEMLFLAAEREVPVILMHMKGTPETMQIAPSYDDFMQEIKDYLSGRVDAAMQAGIKREKIILDPGIGFGKTVTHNLMLIKHLEQLHSLGFPLLMGPSRKSFITNILKSEFEREVPAVSLDAEKGTLAAVAACIMNGSQIIRVHDVAAVKPLVHILDAIREV